MKTFAFDKFTRYHKHNLYFQIINKEGTHGVTLRSDILSHYYNAT